MDCGFRFWWQKTNYKFIGPQANIAFLVMWCGKFTTYIIPFSKYRETCFRKFSIDEYKFKYLSFHFVSFCWETKNA